LFFCMPQ